LAVVSVSVQLAESFMKLYRFWASVRDAPDEVRLVLDDLLYLSAVLNDVPPGQNSSVDRGLEWCKRKKCSSSPCNTLVPHSGTSNTAVGLPESPPSYELSVDGQPQHYIRPEEPQLVSDISVENIQASMENELKTAVEGYFQSGKFAQMMNNTIQRAIEVKSTYHGRYIETTVSHRNPSDSDSGTEDGQFRKPANSEHRISRTRICHSTSARGTLFGNVWLRTSTLKVDDSDVTGGGKCEIISSIIFYPAQWVNKIGLGYGMEANLTTSSSGWGFNVSPIRAVPDDSLIFDFCKTGNLPAVRRLIARGDASVRDTSSKGWTPLHFAAEAADPELCEFLISAGADKTALAFEVPAERKKQMLRLFTDCLELSEPTSDGWTVIASLVHAYNKEDVSVRDNSVVWLLTTLSTDGMVAFGPKTIWCGLQHATRSFLVHERDNRILERILGFREEDILDSSYGKSIAHWLALQAVHRELLPMLIEAGIRLRIFGFDRLDQAAQWGRTVTARQIPVLYTTWTKTLPRSIERMDEVIAIELGVLLAKAECSMDGLRNLCTANKPVDDQESLGDNDIALNCCCTSCGDDYTTLPIGLVAPAWITFTECRKTMHSFNCTCPSFLRNFDSSINSEPNSGLNGSAALPGTFIDDETYFDDGEDDDKDPAEENLENVEKTEALTAYADKAFGTPDSNPLLSSVTTLYRAQARTWLENYRPGDRLCVLCLLIKEGYISEEGLGAEQQYTRMPDNYKKWGVE
ncbi:hypothetical protein K469DRAFT_608169, partial [Zopfia rhizophila CBS 207.26]